MNTSNGKKNKNRSSMSNMSSNVSNRPPNRSSNRNSNGQNASSVNHYSQQSQSRNNMNNANNNLSMNNTNNTSNINDVCNGIYKNKRLVHSMTTLIGCLIEVQLADGQSFEGILKTFSPNFELCLSAAAPVVEETSVEKRNSSMLGTNIGNLLACLEKNGELKNTLVIDPKKMVKFKALNVDLEYPTKRSMATDSEIARTDGKLSGEKDLVPWNDDGEMGDICTESLEDNRRQSNGWQSADMFKYNETVFNISSTYRDEMPEYTIPLKQRFDDDYLQKEARAQKIAREIEKDPLSTQRYAKENDGDEETRFSAVVRDPDEATGGNSTSNYNHSKNDLNHPRGDDRRDMRNNYTDNSGFRTQNSRQSRNRMSSNRNANSGINEANWREQSSTGRVNTNRFHQNHSMSYGGSGAKSGNSGYNNTKYPPSNANVNQYNSSSAKSSYSAVSARNNPPNEPPTSNENNEYKSYSNRSSHGSSSKEHYPNDDSYSRRSSSGLAQRDSYKQRNMGRSVEQDSSPKSVPHGSSKDSPTDVHPSTAPQPTSHTTNVPPPSTVSASVPSQVDAVTAKSPPVKTETNVSSQHRSKQKLPEDNSQTTSVPKAVEQKKSEQAAPILPAPPTTTAPVKQIQPSTQKEVSNEIEAKKIDHPQPISTNTSALTNSESPVAANSPTGANAAPVNAATTGTPTSTSAPVVSSPDIVKSSSLNPHAKSFMPRTNTNFIQQQPAASSVVPNYHQYQSQHISTTPPSIPSTPSIVPQSTQFISINHPMQSHMAPPHVHHQSQQQAHAAVAARYNPMQFSHYNTHLIPHQMMTAAPHQLSQYIMPTMPSHSVYAGPVPGAVPTPTSQSAGPPSGNGQNGPGQMNTHHMIPNSSGGPTQGPPNQSHQGQSSRGPYRGNKGNNNHVPQNSNQQYIRGQQHHTDYSQPSQVANVTGQPIMAPPNHQISVAYSTAAAVHHHNQSQGHQQPPNMGAGQLGPQPCPNQPMSYLNLSYPGFHSRPISIIPQTHPQALNLAPTLQPGLHYDQIPIYCEVPSMVQQTMPPQVQQPNMQTSGNNSGGQVSSTTGQVSNTPSNQGGQGPSQPAY